MPGAIADSLLQGIMKIFEPALVMMMRVSIYGPGAMLRFSCAFSY